MVLHKTIDAEDGVGALLLGHAELLQRLRFTVFNYCVMYM